MKKHVLILIMIFLAVYIIPLNVRPLVDPDETRYAEIPREMIASGDYVVPRLDNVLYFEKPVMGYWLNVLSMKTFGENNFAVRLPSALLTGLSSVIVFYLAYTFIGGAGTALIASLIFLSSLEVFGIGVFNTLDGILSFFLSTSMMFFFLAWHHRETLKTYLLFLFLSGIFCGFACHTKGFLAFAVPVVVIVPFLIWEGKWKEIFKVPWIPVVTALLVMLPWGLAIHHRDSDFWNFFFWNEHIRRFLHSNAQHKEPFYFFFVVILLGAFPWTVLFPATVSGFAKNRFNTPFRRYVLCWFLFPFLFFSASSGKLATYILPCFPPLALLISMGLSDYLSSGKKRLVNGASIIMILFPVLAVTAVILIQTGHIPDTDALYADKWKILIFTLSMAVFACLLFLSAKAENIQKKLILFAFSPLLFYISAHFLAPDEANRRNSPCPFIMSFKDRIAPDALVVSASTPIKSVCWSLKRSDVYLLDEEGELFYGFSRENVKKRHLTFDDFKEMVILNKGVHKVVLILDERRFLRWKDNLPQPASIENNGKDGYIIAMY